MDRLEGRAEEAMANGDPDTAAMNAGKAALMAGQLARKKQADQATTYQVLEAFLRAQEHAYRALALFARAGGQPPASSGVCGSLSQAYHQLSQATRQIETEATAPLARRPQLHESIKQWSVTLDGLREDFQCRSGP